MKIMHNSCTCGSNIPPPIGEKVQPLGEKIFNIRIFRQKASKYTKLMIELYVCDILNQNY